MLIAETGVTGLSGLGGGLGGGTSGGGDDTTSGASGSGAGDLTSGAGLSGAGLGGAFVPPPTAGEAAISWLSENAVLVGGVAALAGIIGVGVFLYTKAE